MTLSPVTKIVFGDSGFQNVLVITPRLSNASSRVVLERSMVKFGLPAAVNSGSNHHIDAGQLSDRLIQHLNRLIVHLESADLAGERLQVGNRLHAGNALLGLVLGCLAGSHALFARPWFACYSRGRSSPWCV